MMWITLITAAILAGFLPASNGDQSTATIISISSVVVGLGFLGHKIYYYSEELCNDSWIINDLAELNSRLGKHLLDLYGQHLADKAVRVLVPAHRKNNPQSALVLSLHGRTGTGKNHLGRILARSLYTKGAASKYVHTFSGTKDFPRAELTKNYKDNIKRTVEEKAMQCAQQLFIFDEIDKMPDGLLDVLSPYVDFYESLDGVDYRKSIFLFLSNSGGEILRDHMVKHWRAGKPREELELSTIERDMLTEAYSKTGALKNSVLIAKGFISYVPFLPLQRSHVSRCIEDNMKSKNITITPQFVNMVMKELDFDIKGEFSNTGCKFVNQKVDYTNEILYG